MPMATNFLLHIFDYGFSSYRPLGSWKERGSSSLPKLLSGMG